MTLEEFVAALDGYKIIVVDLTVSESDESHFSEISVSTDTSMGRMRMVT
jgi:hypothetical protein